MKEFIVSTTAAFKDIIPTGLQPKFSAVTAEGDRVAAEFEGNATLANGERYCNQYCMTYRLENGLIKEGAEYFCTLLADEKILPMLAELEKERQQAVSE